MNKAEFVKVKDLAEQMGVTQGKVLSWIRRGDLRAIDVSDNPKCGRPRWRIPVEAVAEFIDVRSNRRPAPADPAPKRVRLVRRRATKNYV